jgi:hypothetical protein
LGSDVVLLTASISPDLFTAPPPRNAISLIKEGFRDKSKHLRHGARRREPVARGSARAPQQGATPCHAPHRRTRLVSRRARCI